MRKQKLFKRVSAWLLAWTMVLSALSGSVTAWAQEPEEVEVQIEAETETETDVQTEVETDGEIEAEADGEIEAEVDGEIEADTEGETEIDAEGESQDEQGEDALLTGLVAYTGLEWDEDGKITGTKDSPKKELEMDLNGGILYLADKVEKGTETPVKYETPPKGSRLAVWFENQPASSSDYKLSQLDEAGCFKINFYKTGTYRIYITYWSTSYGGSYEIKDINDSANYIKVAVDYPVIGFYQEDKISEEAHIYTGETYRYKPGDSFYMIMYPRDGETVSLDVENGISFDGGDLSIEEVPQREYKTYKITIGKYCQEKFALKVSATVKDGDEKEEVKETSLNLACNPEGLNVSCANGDDPEAFDPGSADKTMTWNWKEKLYFCNISGKTAEQIMGETALKLHYLKGETEIEVTGDNKETYGTIQISEEDGDNEKGLFKVDLKRVGTYKVTADGVEGFVIIKVPYPEYAFYTTSDLSENGLVVGKSEYGRNGNRTFYLLKRDDDVTGEAADVRAILDDEDKTEEFIKTEKADNGLKITIDKDCEQDFELKGAIKIDGPVDWITLSCIFVPCEHKGETEVRNKKEATCTEAGYTGDTYCKDCGKEIEHGKETPKTEHKWDAGKVTKPATETEKGVKTYTCQNGCGETKTEEIPVLEKQPDPEPEQPQPQPQGAKIADPSGNTYKVTSDSQAKEPTVEYTAPKKGAKGTVKVPDSVTVDGVVYKVTAIADNAFKGNKKVTKVTVGKNVISIGRNAFSGCAKLKSVTIGAGVMEISDSAFKGCAALTKITLPAKVQKIGKNAFAGCKKLKMIIIKSTKLTTKSVSKGAFKGLTAKTTIKVPRSKLKAYKALFKKKGLPKNVKVKA